jgi:hypothetical protein
MIAIVATIRGPRARFFSRNVGYMSWVPWNIRLSIVMKSVR